MHLIATIVLNALIGISLLIIGTYFVIYYRIKKHAMKLRTIYLLFTIGIFTGGVSRILKVIADIIGDAVILIELIDFMMVVLMCLLIPMIPPFMKRALSFRSVEQYNQLNEELTGSLEREKIIAEAVRKVNHELVDRVQTLENLVYRQGWLSEAQLQLWKLKEIVTELRKEYKKE